MSEAGTKIGLELNQIEILFRPHVSVLESAGSSWNNAMAFRVEAAELQAAEQHIASCEACNPSLAEVPFESVLDCITGCDPESTDYVLPKPARCPNCAAEVLTGYWHWSTSEEASREAFIMPGTLVTLKTE